MTPRNTNLLIVTSSLSSVAIIVFVLIYIMSLERRIDELNKKQLALTAQHELAEDRNQELQVYVASLESDIAELQKPQAVEGPAQFPVSRVLARKNDTIAAMALRENTSSDIIYALNPWLNGRQELAVGQAIWIPNHRK